MQSLDAFNALQEAYVEEEQEQEELAEQEAEQEAVQEAVSDELNQQYANPDLGYDSSYRLQDSTDGVLSQIVSKYTC